MREILNKFYVIIDNYIKLIIKRNYIIRLTKITLRV